MARARGDRRARIAGPPSLRPRADQGHALRRAATARRLQLHRDAAAALEEVYAARPRPAPGRAGAPLLPAAPAGVAEQGGRLRPPRRRSSGGPARLRGGGASLRDGADAGRPRTTARCDLLLELGDAQARAGDMRAAQGSFLEAADLAERLGLARAACRGGARLRRAGSSGRSRAATPSTCRCSSGRWPRSAMRTARCGSGCSRGLAGGPLRDTSLPAQRKRGVSEEALAMARRLGDPGTIAYAIAGFIPANHSPEFIPTRSSWGPS